MRTPAEFVVTRRLLSEPGTEPAEIARACHIRASTVAAAYHRVRAQTALQPNVLLQHLMQLAERPRWKTLHFHMPNPDNWMQSYPGERWLSGEVTAALEGYDLVPERWLVYLRPEDMDMAVQAVRREVGKVAPPTLSNLMLRTVDPWMVFDPASEFVEKGQRLYDYWHSKHIQLTKALMHD